MADYQRRLAERVRHERERQSLSIDALALKADVSDKTIKRIEDQKVDNPRPVTIRRIAQALKVDPEKLRPPPELEADQLDRIEAELTELRDGLLAVVDLLLGDAEAQAEAAESRADRGERDTSPHAPERGRRLEAARRWAERQRRTPDGG